MTDRTIICHTCREPFDNLDAFDSHLRNGDHDRPRQVLHDAISRMCADLDHLSRTLRVHGSDRNASNADWLCAAEETIARLKREANAVATD